MIDSHVELSVQSVVHSFFFVHPSIVERLFESLGQTKDQCLKLDQVVDIKDVGIIKEPKWIETEDAGVGFGFGGKHFLNIFSLSAPKNFLDRQSRRQEIRTFKAKIDGQLNGGLVHQGPTLHN